MTATLRAPSRARRVRRAARPARQHALARRCCACFVGPIVLLHLRPFLVDAWHGRIYSDAFYEPYASWYPELPRGVYVAPAVPRRGRRGARCALGLLHAARHDHDVRDRHLQPVPLHHPLPQQPRLPRDRARGARGGAVRARALARRGGCGAAAGLPPLDLSAPAWPLWLLRFECAAVYARVRHQQAARPRLVRRHRQLAAHRPGQSRPAPRCPTGRSRSSPTATSTPSPPSSSSRPSCSSRSASGRAAPATPRSGSPSSSTSASSSPRPSRSSPSSASPCS